MGKEELDYLEEERKKLWKEILALKDKFKKLQKYTPEEVQEILDKSEQIDVAQSQIQETLESVVRKNQTISGFLSDITECSEKSTILYTNIETSYKKVEELLQSATKSSNESIGLLAQSKQTRTDLDAVISDLKIKTQALQDAEVLLTSVSEIKDKIDLTYANINKYFADISKLHKEIYGFSGKNDDEEEIIITGLKNELDVSYKKLTEELKNLNSEISSAIKSSSDNSKDVRSYWENEHHLLKTQIESLLPGALSAGLSSAYKDKKDNEIEAMKISNIGFNKSIKGLIAVSLIPFAVSIYMLLDGTILEDLILKLPRLVSSILPLYIPIMWMAYSSSKKVNLSKRLIEEYSHKEALSKTFEGLSEQINNIKESHSRDELRAKLLYNLLEVSAENPGKLISDYNNADHPLMDALDKSVKLSEAITKIAKIPGMTKFTTALIEKNKKLNAEMNEKANDGIEVAEEINQSKEAS